ncbi:hypothetical protein TKK_0014546 [Trichogramma kaykai]
MVLMSQVHCLSEDLLSSEEGDMPQTYAEVKIIHNKEVQVISIDSIHEFNDLNWPDHETDFDVKKIYTCDYKDENCPDKATYGIQIARFKFSTPPVELDKKKKLKTGQKNKSDVEQNKNSKKKNKQLMAQQRIPNQTEQLELIKKKRTLLNVDNLKMSSRNDTSSKSGSTGSNISNLSKKISTKATYSSPSKTQTEANVSCLSADIAEAQMNLLTRRTNRSPTKTATTENDHRSPAEMSKAKTKTIVLKDSHISPALLEDPAKNDLNRLETLSDHSPVFGSLTSEVDEHGSMIIKNKKKGMQTSRHQSEESEHSSTNTTPKSSQKSAQFKERAKEDLFNSSTLLTPISTNNKTDRSETLLARICQLETENEELRMANKNLTKAVDEGKKLYRKAQEKINSHLILQGKLKDIVTRMSIDGSSEMQDTENSPISYVSL